MEILTTAEMSAIRSAVKSALELRKSLVTPELLHAYREEPKMRRKQKRLRTKEIPILKSALSKLQLIRKEPNDNNKKN